LKIYSTTAF